MSHTVTISAQIRDPAALGAACRRMSLQAPILRTAQLFGETLTGHCVELPEWRYPVVCQLDSGKISYDNYQGRWGDSKHLDQLVQSYAVEKTLLEARRQGRSVQQQQLADGSVKLTISIGETV